MRIAPALMLCAALLFTACGAPNTGSHVPGGQPAEGRSSSAPTRLTIAIRSDPKALTAKLNSAAGAGGSPGAPEIEQMLNSGLGVETKAGGIFPQLAEAVPSAENGLWQVFPDG